MARPKEFDEAAALDAAIHVFREQGYAAASLSELTARMGIGRPSLYATFGDKRHLFLAALARDGADTLAALGSALGAEPSARAALRTVFEEFVTQAEAGTGTHGDLCVNTLAEFGSRDSEIAERLRRHQAAVEALFHETLARGRAHGEFWDSLDLTATARFLAATRTSLLLLLKLRPAPTAVRDVVTTALKALEM